MSEGRAGVGDVFRKIVSFALLVASVVALVAFFMGSASYVFEPFKEAFNPFDFTKLGTAIYGFMDAISTPLIMAMLGIIGLTVDR